MASLRLGIAASLKEASGPTACGRQDEARPTASPATQQKRRRKAAHAAKPAQETKRGRLRDREKPKRVSPCERDSNLSVTVGEHVDALWPADGEYYPAGIRAVNADGTISLAYDDGDTRSDARTHELRHKRPPTGAHPDTVSTEAHCASVTCSETSAVPAVSSSIEGSPISRTLSPTRQPKSQNGRVHFKPFGAMRIIEFPAAVEGEGATIVTASSLTIVTVRLNVSIGMVVGTVGDACRR